MKYEYEYKNTTTREDFIKLVLKNNKKIKKSTAMRRYYDLRKKIKNKRIFFDKHYEEKKNIIENKKNLDEEFFVKPNILKILMVEDMKKLNIKISKEVLIKNGFFPYEINWILREEQKNGN